GTVAARAAASQGADGVSPSHRRGAAHVSDRARRDGAPRVAGALGAALAARAGDGDGRGDTVTQRHVTVRCPGCGGHGVREAFGGGPVECRVCDGGGTLTVYESGHCALYPGGPLRGSWPGEYELAMATDREEGR